MVIAALATEILALAVFQFAKWRFLDTGSPGNSNSSFGGASIRKNRKFEGLAVLKFTKRPISRHFRFPVHQ